MPPKTGIILVNLGSPDAPTPAAVRRYLFQFLHDKRVIETSRWIWCPILHGIILRVRPARSARAYRKIWDYDGGEEGSQAPLVRITQAQGSAVQALLGDDVDVQIAMRYGNPSVDSVVNSMMENGITQIGIVPLYPQYAGATTASVYDAVHKTLKASRNVPDLRLIRDYHNHPDYISALASSIDEHIKSLEWKPDAVLASFHGMPQSYVDKGDPYASECEATTSLLRKSLGMNEDQLMMTYQSRFGPMQWLQPYTDITLEEMPSKGIKSVAIVTPGFASDCLETLEEINMEARESFMEAGGENFSYIPCLNTRDDHIALLANLIEKRLLPGWL